MRKESPNKKNERDGGKSSLGRLPPTPAPQKHKQAAGVLDSPERFARLVTLAGC